MEPILRNYETVDWITVLLFASLVFVGLAKRLFYGRFLNFVILPFNNKYIFMYNKKDRLINWFHIFFTIFQIINCALFIYLSRNVLLGIGHGEHPGMFPIILGLVLLYLIAKVFLQLGNGYIFGAKKIISEIIFKKLSYLNYSGGIMCCANVLLSFVTIDSKIVVYASIFLILLVNAIGWVTALRNHQNFIATHFFYFILYLCALEIAPLVLIGSYLNH